MPGAAALVAGLAIAVTTAKRRPDLRPSAGRGLLYVLAALMMAAGVGWIALIGSLT